MKTILILAVSLFTFSAISANKTFTHSVSAETEALVLEKVEVAIPKIISGKIKSIWQRDAGCFPNNSRTIKVNSVSIKKSYKVDSYGNLTPFYSGQISYTHKRCRADNN